MYLAEHCHQHMVLEELKESYLQAYKPQEIVSPIQVVQSEKSPLLGVTDVQDSTHEQSNALTDSEESPSQHPQPRFSA